MISLELCSTCNDSVMVHLTSVGTSDKISGAVRAAICRVPNTVDTLYTRCVYGHCWRYRFVDSLQVRISTHVQSRRDCVIDVIGHHMAGMRRSRDLHFSTLKRRRVKIAKGSRLAERQFCI